MFGFEGAELSLPDRSTSRPKHSTSATELSLIAQNPNTEYDFDAAARKAESARRRLAKQTLNLTLLTYSSRFLSDLRNGCCSCLLFVLVNVF